MGTVIERLTSELGRSPLPIEVAQAMNATVDEVIQATEAGNAYRSSSLDSPSADGDTASRHEGARMASDDPGLAGADLRLTVATLLEQLEPRERRIVELRFFGERTQSEIAAEVGVSQVHVSRLLRSSFERMQAVLGSQVVA